MKSGWGQFTVRAVSEIVIIVGAFFIHFGLGLMVGGLITWWEVTGR